MSGIRNSFRWRKDTKKVMTRICKSPTGFGFTVAWTKPPEINFVDEGSSASRAGLTPGDKILSINKVKVSKKGKEEVTEIVKGIKGEMELEIEREESSVNRKYSSFRLKGEKSKSSSVKMEVNVIGWKRERALLNLLQCEEDLLNTLREGKEQIVIPLRRESQLATPAELDILFGNLLAVCTVMDRCVQPLRETTRKNEDLIGVILLQQMGTRCFALQKYLHGLALSKVLLQYKLENEKFSTFVKGRCLELAEVWAYLEKPHKYLNDLVSRLECLLSYTAVGHNDYVSLEAAMTKFRAFTKNMSSMVEKQRKLDKKSSAGPSVFVGEDPYPNLENLQKKVIFTTSAKPLDLIFPGRYWLFAGHLMKIEGKYYIQHWALLLSDTLYLTRVTKDGVLIVTEDPLVLSRIRHAVFEVPKSETEFHIVFETESAFESSTRRFRYPSVFPARKWITWTLRAPSMGMKQVWHTILMEQLSKITSIQSSDYQASAKWNSPKSDQTRYHESSFSTEPKQLSNLTTKKRLDNNRQDDVQLDDYKEDNLDIFESVRDSHCPSTKKMSYKLLKDIRIPYIDSSEELSSGTESNTYLDEVERVPSRKLRRNIPLTSDKNIQTDVTTIPKLRKTLVKLEENHDDLIKLTYSDQLLRVPYSKSVPKGLSIDSVMTEEGMNLRRHMDSVQESGNGSMPDLGKFRCTPRSQTLLKLDSVLSRKVSYSTYC